MRTTILIIALVLLLGGGIAWLTWSVDIEEGNPVGDKIVKPDSEWRKVLTAEQYHITREAGTEPPGTGEYANCHKDGVYTCVCCGQPLFDSKTKFESHSGWPSFYDPVSADNLTKKTDRKLVLHVRTEVLCSRCNAHLGHVFNDGPEPTGLRYCINSAALKLVEREPTSNAKE